MDLEAKIAVSLGKEIERLRRKRGLSQPVLGLYYPYPKSHGFEADDISQIETGRRIPTFEMLEAIAVGLETTASALLSKIGLSEQEFKDIRPRWHKNIYLPSWWEMEASTAKDINAWLGEDVIKRRRGRPRSIGDLDELNFYISQLFAGVRHSGTTYPGRPLVRNPNIHLPRDGVQLWWDHPFLQSLTQGYFGEGPRITMVGGVPQKLWPMAISKKLLNPIIERGDARAALASK
jgi:transcriptional regulator with XRE-family HTH domain